MATINKNTLPPDFHNPFEGRDSEEVWKELKKNAKPISREEMLRQLKEQAQQKDASNNKV